MVGAGIDASFTGTGLAVRDEDGFRFKTIKTKPDDFKDDTDRIRYIRDEILKGIPEGATVYIEDVFVGRGPSAGASLRLSLLAGCIRAGLRDKGIPFEIVPPPVLKKYITGKGNAQKDVIMLKVFQRFGVEPEDNNQADSICLADMAYNGFEIKRNRKGNAQK